MRFIQTFSTVLRGDGKRYFRTKNLHLAAILSSQGFALVNVDRQDTANCEFVFRKTSELEQMVERFESKLPIFVDARRFIYAWKFLREKLQGRNSNHYERGL